MRYRVALAVLIWLFGLAAARLPDLPFLQLNLESYAESFRQTATSGLRPDPQIVLAGIDDQALTPEYFHRGVHAQVLRNLSDCGVRMVFFDLIFDEDRDPEVDQPFLEALRNGVPTILAGTAAVLETETGVAIRPPQLAPNLAPALESGRVTLASIEKAPPSQGLEWPYFLALRFDDSGLMVPSAALAAYAVYQSVAPPEIRYLDGFVEVPPVRIPVQQPPSDGSGVSVLTYDLKFHTPATGPGHQPGPDTYRVIPYLELLDPSAELRESLLGTIVVIGENTSSTTDIVLTPAGPMKGFEGHAQCLDRLIHRVFYRSLSEEQNRWLTAGLAAVVAVQAVFTWPFAILLLLGPLLIGGYVAVNLWLFDSHHLVVGLSHPVLAATVAFVGLILVRLVLASRFLGRFIPKEAARNLLRAERTAKATEATVIVTDIRGYTTLSETRTPVEMLELLNEYHSVTVDIYHRHGGNVLTFQGDAQLVVFGYPRRLQDPAGAAWEACLEVMSAIDELRAKWGIQERKNFDVGAGICTGLVYVGDIGSREQANYTVIGEVVRTSHKVQSMSDALEGNVLMDEPSYQACRKRPRVTVIPNVALEGFPEPKTLYRVEP